MECLKAVCIHDLMAWLFKAHEEEEGRRRRVISKYIKLTFHLERGR